MMIYGLSTCSVCQKARKALEAVSKDGHLKGEPKMIRIDYDIVVDTDETDARIDLLHRNLQKFGTIYNTLAGATDLTGTIRRKD